MSSPMEEFAKRLIEKDNYTNLRSMRLYHQVYPDLKELRFDTFAFIDERSRGFIPTTVANLTIDDAKQLMGILQLFIAEVE